MFLINLSSNPLRYCPIHCAIVFCNCAKQLDVQYSKCFPLKKSDNNVMLFHWKSLLISLWLFLINSVECGQMAHQAAQLYLKLGFDLVRFPNCIVYYQSRGWGTWLVLTKQFQNLRSKIWLVFFSNLRASDLLNFSPMLVNTYRRYHQGKIDIRHPGMFVFSPPQGLERVCSHRRRRQRSWMRPWHPPWCGHCSAAWPSSGGTRWTRECRRCSPRTPPSQP